MSVKGDDRVCIRLPAEVRAALEQERQRMSRAAGVEVRKTDVLRKIIDGWYRPFQRKRRVAARITDS